MTELRILVRDDEPAMLDIMLRRLDRIGIKLACAGGDHNVMGTWECGVWGNWGGADQTAIEVEVISHPAEKTIAYQKTHPKGCGCIGKNIPKRTLVTQYHRRGARSKMQGDLPCPCAPTTLIHIAGIGSITYPGLFFCSRRLQPEHRYAP